MLQDPGPVVKSGDEAKPADVRVWRLSWPALLQEGAVMLCVGAAYTGLEPIYVSKLVRALEQGGLIVRVPDPADARAVQLTLTDRGKEVIDQAVKIVHDLHGTLTAPLGGPDSAETRALAAALQTLLHGVPEPDTTPAEGDVP